MPEHNEVVCHATGERRQNYLNQIKCILDKMDAMPCVEEPSGTKGEAPGSKPLIEYPGYINRLNPKFNKPFYIPLITNVQVKEIRKTANPEKYMNENSRNLEYRAVGGLKDGAAQAGKSQQLKGGYIIQGCDCIKHNGLQDQCPRSECGGRPWCLTEPRPTCPPALAYVDESAGASGANTTDAATAEALARYNPPKVQYCCCNTDCNGGAGGNPAGPDKLPANFECYPCSH